MTVDGRFPQSDDVIDVEDRIGAVGGRLSTMPTPSGFNLVAEVPCASS